MSILFVTGTDTDIGKSFATGLLARFLHRQGRSVITQKLAQTGCEGYSEDIETHRRLMGMEPNEDDRNGLTCPYIFRFPASPHLAARMEHQVIDPQKITTATQALAEKYETVIVEGVGGIYVPLNEEVTLADYLEARGYPLIIVTSSKLGSINHTLMTLDIAKHRNLNVLGLVYNRFPLEKAPIVQDSKAVFKSYLERFGYPQVIADIPVLTPDRPYEIDFSALFSRLR